MTRMLPLLKPASPPLNQNHPINHPNLTPQFIFNLKVTNYKTDNHISAYSVAFHSRLLSVLGPSDCECDPADTRARPASDPL